MSAQRGTLPAAKVVDAIHAASGGNPFLAEALLEELHATDRRMDDPATAKVVAGLGPNTVSRAMLGRLTPEALRLAGAVAVLGTRADPWLAGSVAGLAAEEL